MGYSTTGASLNYQVIWIKLTIARGNGRLSISAREALAKLEMVAPVSQSELSRAEDQENWRSEPR